MAATIHHLNLQTVSSSDLHAAIEAFTRVSESIDNRPREGYVLDFKQDWNDSGLKTVASFANTFGGTLIVGVSELDGRPDKLLGVQCPNELKTRIAGSIATSLYPCPSFEIGECSLPSDGSKKLAVVRVQETSEVCLITKKNVTPNPIHVRNEDRSDPADAAQSRALLQRKASLQNVSKRKGFNASFLTQEFWITKVQSDGTVRWIDTHFRVTIEPSSAAITRLDMALEKQFRDMVFQKFRGIENRPKLDATLDRDR